MNKFMIKQKLAKGQVLPLVALMMFALIAMAALILDGGTLLSYRRTAQAAADAGAMAGAQHQCYDLSTNPGGVAVTYATNNGAKTATADVGDYLVTVNTTVVGDSFFAKIFGVDQLRATAEATAGCLGVRGRGVIPLAWRCWPNDEVNPAFNEEYGCQVQPLDWDNVEPFIKGTVNTVTISGVAYERHTDGTSIVRDPIVAAGETVPVPPGQIYILFDSEKLCIEEYYDKCSYDGTTHEITSCNTEDGTTVVPPDLAGDIQCDLTGDGKLDIQVGGDRGLIYLTSSTSNINEWITSDTQPDITLKPHVWLTADSGVGSAVLKMQSVGWSGEIVLIPVYNAFCEDKPDQTQLCIDEAHLSPPWPEFTGEDRFDMKPGGSLWFHIIAFQPFYLSCTSKSGDCPGYRYAQTFNADLKDNVPVAEGFFLSDYDDTGLDAQNFCDIDLGNCRISLTEKP